jgi:hypothetical protein
VGGEHELAAQHNQHLADTCAHLWASPTPVNTTPSMTTGHSKIGSTVRYLGIEIDDAIEIGEKINI